MRSVIARLDALDRTLFDLAAARPSPALDRVLPPLTRSADHGRLWLGTAGALVLLGRRRAAARGLASLALASAVANLPAKQTARRRRPGLTAVPGHRLLLRQPTTTSLPSGHSASAAAFALGAALEDPWLAAPVGLLAAGVAYGRVHTGVHYPGDVVAGLALGAGAAVAVKRAWPARPSTPAHCRPAEAPALADGDGLVVVVNLAGGSADQVDELDKLLGEQLPAAELVRVDADVEPVLRDAARRARALGVMGGDGTVSCAAAIAHAAGLPLAVFPGGTLNHFAGELGLTTAQQTLDAVRDGTAVQVCLASAGDGMTFVNTFALGTYPDIVRLRERHAARFGTWPAAAWATMQVMRQASPVTVLVDGVERRVWTLFAGNGRYQPSGFAPRWRERLDDGCIDVRVVDASQALGRTRVTLGLLTGLLHRTRAYQERVVGRLEVASRTALPVAVDGEVRTGVRRLTLQADPVPLAVYRS